MKEILFRGQTRRYGEKVRMGDGFKLPSRWVYGGVLQGVSDHSIIYGGENVDDPGDGLDKWCVYTDTLGQFTGKTDKNGKKVFEGDLLNGFSYPYYRSEEDTHNYFAEVVWFDGNCAFGLVTHKNPTSTVRGISDGNADFIEDFDPDDWEIIGNIHDNPELMEVHENGSV